MILSVGGRTDIVTYYGDWLMNRFREGYVFQRNPLFPNRVTRYELSPEKIDAIYFCSKNYAPFLKRAAELAKVYRTYFHYTITAYGKDYEPNIPSCEESVETFIRLTEAVGKRRVVWRYDPVLISADYPAERHYEAFEKLARALRGYTDRCVFGFAETHKSMIAAIPTLVPLVPRLRDELAARFAAIAAAHGIRLRLCRANGKYAAYGIETEGCVTLSLLGEANNCDFRDVRHSGNRRGCRCIASRDIGAYETCPNLCVYCYANTDPALVRENRLLHDDASPLLVGNVLESDIFLQGSQESYLKHDGRQMSFFDLG